MGSHGRIAGISDNSHDIYGIDTFLPTGFLGCGRWMELQAKTTIHVRDDIMGCIGERAGQFLRRLATTECG